jgi:hypothetical protein
MQASESREMYCDRQNNLKQNTDLLRCWRIVTPSRLLPTATNRITESDSRNMGQANSSENRWNPNQRGGSSCEESPGTRLVGEERGII